MSSLPKMMYRVNAIPVKIPACYFVCINKLIVKFIQRSKNLRIVNTVLKENNKVGGLILLNFKI